MKTTTKTTTTTNGKETTTMNKTTKRIEQTKVNNAKRIEQTKVKLETITDNKENIINIKAIEIMQRLKQTKDRNDVQLSNLCYTLVTILAQSKLKHLNNNANTYNENNARLKREIALSIDRNGNGTKRDVYINTLDSLYHTEYNKDGERITVCTDKKRAQQIEQQITKLNQYDDGMDIIQESVLKLWYYINQAIENGIDNASDTYLLDTFQIVIQHTKLYKNQNVKPYELWQYTTTNAIKEISKEISRQIENLRAVRDTNVCYTDIETEIYNEQTQEIETITQYRKVDKLSITEITDYNGKLIAQTADNGTIEMIKTILEKANFTKNQAYIFKHHYTNKESIQEIADKLKVTERYINSEIDKIKTKCISTGVFANYGLTENDRQRTTNEQRKTSIIYTDTNGNILQFDSIGKAGKILNISKSHISEILRGVRKTANGYTFNYSEN